MASLSKTPSICVQEPADKTTVSQTEPLAELSMLSAAEDQDIDLSKLEEVADQLPDSAGTCHPLMPEPHQRRIAVRSAKTV